MNRLINICLFLLSAIQSYGQTEQDIVIKNAIKSRSITEIENSNDKFKFKKINWDLLNKGIVQTNWQLSKKKNLERIGLLTLSINSEIIYSEVYSWDINNEMTGRDYKKINSWTNDNNTSIVFNPEYLVRLPSRSTFGYLCGGDAQMPKEGIVMLNLVKEKNTKELTNWLNSINPVRQAYAYLGFSLLKARGIEIGVDIKNKMYKLKVSEIPIYSCSGCTDWAPEILSKLLSDKQVEQFVQRNLE